MYKVTEVKQRSIVGITGIFGWHWSRLFAILHFIPSYQPVSVSIALCTVQKWSTDCVVLLFSDKTERDQKKLVYTSSQLLSQVKIFNSSSLLTCGNSLYLSTFTVHHLHYYTDKL